MLNGPFVYYEGFKKICDDAYKQGKIQALLDEINDTFSVKIMKSQVNPTTAALCWACENGYTEDVKLLLKDKFVEPSAANNYPIGVASRQGHANVVELLLQDARVDPSDDNNYPIRIASSNGHANIVKMLLTNNQLDPCADGNSALNDACAYGHTFVVELLLKDNRVDPSADDNSAIRNASRNGHNNIVELLLKDNRVNPCARDNEAIRLASTYGHTNVIKMLFKDKRVKIENTINVLFKNAVIFKHLNVIALLLQYPGQLAYVQQNYPDTFKQMNQYYNDALSIVDCLQKLNCDIDIIKRIMILSQYNPVTNAYYSNENEDNANNRLITTHLNMKRIATAPEPVQDKQKDIKTTEKEIKHEIVNKNETQSRYRRRRMLDLFDYG